MNEVLHMILEGEKLSTRQLQSLLDFNDQQIVEEVAKLQQEGILLGWRPIVDSEKLDSQLVRAVIEIKIRPEREGGFDRLALRISRFDEVESCYLMSGAYDLLAVVTGNSLHQVASFISERLSSIDGVLSTATHFMLRAYKEQGFQLITTDTDPDKPAVSA